MMISASMPSYNYQGVTNAVNNAQNTSNTNLATSTNELATNEASFGAAASVLNIANKQGSEVLGLLGNIMDIKA